MALGLICLIVLFFIEGVAQERVIQLPPTWPADGQVPARLKNQYVFLSPQQDVLIVRMPVDENEPDGPRRVVRIPLYNQLQPSIRVAMSSPEPGRYRYIYTISNSSKAKDRIGLWQFVVPLEDEAFDRSHPGTSEHQGWSGRGWTKVLNAPRVGLPGWPLGSFALWARNETSKLVTPGSSVGGFEVSSANKPGFTTAFFMSDTPPPFQLLQGAPQAIHDQMDFYNKDPAWRDSPRVTLGPRYPATTPDFDILKDFQAGIERLVKDKHLDGESPFFRELLKALAERIRNSSTGFKVPAVQPSTAFEAEIKAALEIDFSKMQQQTFAHFTHYQRKVLFPLRLRRILESIARSLAETNSPNWYGNQRQIEHDFILTPGADPRRIEWTFEGAQAVTSTLDALLDASS